jgi:hypothetical protein
MGKPASLPAASGRPVVTQKGAKGPVSFKRDIIPIFRNSCTMCHQGDIPMGALGLTPDVAYDNLVGIQAAGADMPRVDPHKPDRSYLYHKTSGRNALVKGNGYGMPWGQALAPADSNLISRWIEQGALNN